MKLLNFMYWKFWDIRNPKPKKPFGVLAFVGLPGTGKTLSMVELLERTNELYPDIEVSIYTNFGYLGQSGQINSVKDIIEAPDNSIIAIDEVQTIFNSRRWQDFPIEMLSVVTQHRKHAKQLLFTAQSFEHMDKNLRDLANYIVECNTVFGRWIFQRAFHPYDYKLIENEYITRKRAWRHSFVASNDLFNRYDTLKIVNNFKQENGSSSY